jgi:leucyl aminopeptidase
MNTKIIYNQSHISNIQAEKATHSLYILSPSKLKDLPLAKVLAARMKRRKLKYEDLGKTPLHADLPHGGLATWVVLDDKKSVFERHTSLRKALQPLLDEYPDTLTIELCDKHGGKHVQEHAEMALYVALMNSAELPTCKKKSEYRPLKTITVFGANIDDTSIRAVVQGNTLARQLTMLPPNDLTPGIYRDKVKDMAAEHGWQHEEFDMKQLRKMGAGAFVAVAQGSDPLDAAIVHLTYTPKKYKKHIALVGKGICFDTGGHNLKPARYMNGMHEDMNGSAVALGILLAATEASLPVKIDCWLAIAQNHISAKAYKQNDVIKALNGTSIEIVHTDAEGRMVLADTLTLASRQKPDLMLDFATLTGSMAVALGDRYSGILGNNPELLCKAVGIGSTVGERLCAFPFDADYEADLDSKIADIKQCTLDSEGDHILAARFLSRFIVGDIPWLHVDLSSSNRKGGLGAIGSDVTGFGVAFSFRLLQEMNKELDKE